MKERWTGERIKPELAAELSGIGDVAFVDAFEGDFHRMASLGNYSRLYLDCYRADPGDRETPAHRLCRRAAVDYPYLRIKDAGAILRRLRTIKQPCEIEAVREAEKITREGIVAMMKASRPGMYEYQ